MLQGRALKLFVIYKGLLATLLTFSLFCRQMTWLSLTVHPVYLQWALKLLNKKNAYMSLISVHWEESFKFNQQEELYFAIFLVHIQKTGFSLKHMWIQAWLGTFHISSCRSISVTRDSDLCLWNELVMTFLFFACPCTCWLACYNRKTKTNQELAIEIWRQHQNCYLLVTSTNTLIDNIPPNPE